MFCANNCFRSHSLSTCLSVTGKSVSDPTKDETEDPQASVTCSKFIDSNYSVYSFNRAQKQENVITEQPNLDAQEPVQATENICFWLTSLLISDSSGLPDHT